MLIIVPIILLPSQLLFSDFIKDKKINTDSGIKNGIDYPLVGAEKIYNEIYSFTALNIPGTAKSGKNGRIALNYDPYWTIKSIITEGIGIGSGFEAAFLPFLAFKINLVYVAIPQEIIGIRYVLSIINFSGGMRFYYLATGANGPFIGVHGGLFIFSANISNYDVTIPLVPMVMVETGYKWNFMRDKGFFLEPSVGYIFTDPVISLGNSTQLGGIYITINIGWVF
ncbi:MAG: hypothetical protein GF353_00515 [Candidatus Lokiarchaeota archaeon]|nr:hypothetical protein [Candidatus Lokiarchaeota archaeon]